MVKRGKKLKKDKSSTLVSVNLRDALSSSHGLDFFLDLLHVGYDFL